MNPNVARFEGVEAKYRLVMDDSEGAEKLLLSMQRREGEKRIEVAALMLTDKGMQSGMVVMRGEVESYEDIEMKNSERERERERVMKSWGSFSRLRVESLRAFEGVRPMRVFARSSTYHSVGG